MDIGNESIATPQRRETTRCRSAPGTRSLKLGSSALGADFEEAPVDSGCVAARTGPAPVCHGSLATSSSDWPLSPLPSRYRIFPRSRPHRTRELLKKCLQLAHILPVSVTCYPRIGEPRIGRYPGVEPDIISSR
jgi:hypothetical protein